MLSEEPLEFDEVTADVLGELLVRVADVQSDDQLYAREAEMDQLLTIVAMESRRGQINHASLHRAELAQLAHDSVACRDVQAAADALLALRDLVAVGQAGGRTNDSESIEPGPPGSGTAED